MSAGGGSSEATPCKTASSESSSTFARSASTASARSLCALNLGILFSDFHGFFMLDDVGPTGENIRQVCSMALRTVELEQSDAN